MECPKCNDSLTSEFSVRKGLWRCRLCNGIWTDWQQNEITRLTSFLERIKDGQICRRCLASPGEWIMYDEDGNRHSCEKEIAREALE